MSDEPLMHIPPSQQSAQGPVPKPGEPLVPKTVPNKIVAPKSKPALAKPALVMPSPLEPKKV